jgi:hypothetical protein
MVEWIKARIRLKGCNVKELWTEEHDGVVAEFLVHAELRKLVAYLTEDKTLGLLTASAALSPRQFVYFIRLDNTPCTPATIASKVRCERRAWRRGVRRGGRCRGCASTACG